MEETIAIMRELHDMGYLVGIATNQGSTTFKRLVDAQILPPMDYYALVLTADYNKQSSKEKEALKKPSKIYYTTMLNALRKKGIELEHVIFIDDRIKNVKAVENIPPIEGILFTSAPKLRTDLEKLGVLP